MEEQSITVSVSSESVITVRLLENNKVLVVDGVLAPQQPYSWRSLTIAGGAAIFVAVVLWQTTTLPLFLIPFVLLFIIIVSLVFSSLHRTRDLQKNLTAAGNSNTSSGRAAEILLKPRELGWRVKDLKKSFPELRVICSERTANHLLNPQREEPPNSHTPCPIDCLDGQCWIDHGRILVKDGRKECEFTHANATLLESEGTLSLFPLTKHTDRGPFFIISQDSADLPLLYQLWVSSGTVAPVISGRV